MNKKLVILNGPPRSGKDECAKYLYRQNVAQYVNPEVSATFPHWFRMSRPLKDGLRAFFGFTEAEMAELEKHKDKPHALLFGKSWRDVQISLSEQWAKPFFGDEVFGEIALRTLQKSIAQVFVCSDAGFQTEFNPLMKLFAPKDILVIQLDRPGYSFHGDSRSYITIPGAKTMRLVNDQSLQSLYDDVMLVVQTWLKQ